MRQHELKLNPLKCAFGVKAGNFLGFLVHQRGVEVDKNKAKAITEANPPTNKKELQRFLGRVNYLRRFISHLAGKTKEFSQVLKLKDSGEFKWEESHQRAFDVIKRYLSNPHVLMPPRPSYRRFLADHPSLDEFIGEQVGFPVCGVGVQPWELKFDGSMEYEALVIGLEILKDLGAREFLLITWDSQLVLKQLSAEFKCTSLSLAPYYTAASQILDDFEEVSLVHVPRQENWEADELAQSNGQAEVSNKVLIKILQKMMEENPRDWPKLLSETLWAYRTSKRTATRVSPFFHTFGHDAVLPLEIMVPSMRVAKQNELSLEHYNEAMIMDLEELDELRIQAYNALVLQKQKVARIYNKRVNKKIFHEGEIVWKAILPIGTKDRELGKWSLNWEGPFKVHKLLDGNAYRLSSLDGHPHKRCINGKYLKSYFPSMREEVGKSCK
ncbi:uncharacterized protein [Primulina eburnea]|uniref:uncharacterized protein n=1 Tax=Primulina eburnea TaxID=1245227 RepID=UPI003C6BE8FA